MSTATGSETETNQAEREDQGQENDTMARADRRKQTETTRCATCTGPLFVKLTREAGSLRRESYCPDCAARLDVTSAAGRRALFVAAAARELAGAA